MVVGRKEGKRTVKKWENRAPGFSFCFFMDMFPELKIIKYLSALCLTLYVPQMIQAPFTITSVYFDLKLWNDIGGN